jgi:hypothetical protein
LIYIIVIALAIESWHSLRPHLERFDRWLDKKLHQNEYTAAILSMGNDMQRTMARWWEETKTIDDGEVPTKR